MAAAGERSVAAGGARAISAPVLWPRALRGACAALWAEEFSHGLFTLLVAVAFGAGTASYFAVPDEPYAPVPLALAAVCGVAALRLRHRHFAGCVAFMVLAAALCGFGWPGVKARLPGVAPLAQARDSVVLRGFVEAAETRGRGQRVTLRVLASEPSSPAVPQRVRIAMRETGLVAGQAVSVRARLLPLPGQSLPGGYDFGRDVFFAGIGATGFALGRAQPFTEAPPVPFGLRVAALIDAARQSVSQRIRLALPGERGALTDALVTGLRHGISDATNDALRRAGVFHILSISGFHMTLVAAFVFGVMRGLLALVPGVALHHPVKALAGGVALAVSLLYLLLSGAEVATQRSFFMIAFVLVGVMAGREAMTVRNLALAGIIVLVMAPEAVMGPSFQMSFAATLVLVAGAARLVPQLEASRFAGTAGGRTLLTLSHSLFGLMAASLAATLATTPFAAYHFHLVHFYGVVGNVLAAPVIELATMPLAMLALLLWPFGLDGPVWQLAGLSLDLFLALCGFVAGWAGGAVPVRAFGGGALALMTLALLLFGLLRTRLRLLGLVPAALAALLLAFGAERPVLYLDAGGRMLAARGPDGRLALVSREAVPFTLAQWLSAEADGRKPDDPSLVANRRCDVSGCAAPLMGGGWIVDNRKAETLAEDCRMARIVVSDEAPSFSCAAQMVPRARLAGQAASAALSPSGALAVQRDHDPARWRIWRPKPPEPAAARDDEQAVAQPASLPAPEDQ